MGREGGEETFTAKSKEEAAELVKKEHERSKRRKNQSTLSTVCENEAEAKKTAEIEGSRLERRLDDDYNVAVVVPFYSATKTDEDIDGEMELQFSAVEDSFLKVVEASRLNCTISEGKVTMAVCSRCSSQINIEVRKQKRPRDYDLEEGICPICKDDSDLDEHIDPPKLRLDVQYGRYGFDAQAEHNSRVRADHYEKVERLNNILNKIGKRPRVKNSAKPWLFNKLSRRTLYRQPYHADSIKEFKETVSMLLPKRDEIERTQKKGDIHYLVRVSWLSSHDEWQDNSDMDNF